MSDEASTDSLLDRIAYHSQHAPHQVAIDQVGTEKVDYQTLWKASIRLANQLTGDGVLPGSVVCVHSDQRRDFVIGMIAAWLCHAVYFPLPASLPDARKRWLLERVEPSAIIESVDHVLRPSGNHELAAMVAPPLELDSPAYLFFTSGSSGTPKGVLVAHRGIAPMLRQQIERFDLDSTSRCLWLLSPAFDASISDVGTALYCGATLVIDPELDRPGKLAEILERIDRNVISHVDLPPSVLSRLDSRCCPRCLRTIVIGGEVCDPAAIRQWAPRLRLVNVYGPTEATVCTSMAVCDDTWRLPLIGEPMPHVEYRIGKEDQEIGELWIGGSALAIEYWKDATETANRFVEVDGKRYYRSGDRVRRLPDNQYEFKGRMDRQEQFNGHRLEPAEVEETLRRVAGVHEAYVRIDRTGDTPRVMAWVGARQGVREPLIRKHLQAELPKWMVPTAICVMPALPKMVTGKVDLRKLADEPSIDSGNWLLQELRHLLVRPSLTLDDCISGNDLDSLGWLQLRCKAMTRGIDLPSTSFAEDVSIGEVLNQAGGGMTLGDMRGEWEQEFTKRFASGDEGFSLPVEASQSQVMMLTGATGFLGSHVLREMAHASPASIVCLVRAENTAHAARRVLDKLRSQGIDSSQWWDRVRVVSGDVTEPQFALADQVYRDLCNEVCGVVHCAASIHMADSRPQMMQSNFVGTANVVRFCLSGRSKRLIHASSLAVAVDSDHPVGAILPFDLPPESRMMYGPYAQSKVAAEWCIQQAAQRFGLVACRVRFSLLTASRNAPPPAGDLLTMAIAELIRRGVTVVDASEGCQFNTVPVDQAARFLAGQLQGISDSVIHVAAKSNASARDLFESVGRLQETNTKITIQQLGELLDADSPLRLILRRLLAANDAFRFEPLDLFRSSGYRFVEAVGPKKSAVLAGQTAEDFLIHG